MLKSLFRNFRKNWPTEKVLHPSSAGFSTNDCVSMLIYQGIGGVAIQTQSYDRQHDRTRCNFYVIPEGQDLGQEISRILMLEALTK